MSTETRPMMTPVPTPAPIPALVQSLRREKAVVDQIIVYGHSALFYWWPLWAARYVMPLLSWFLHDEAEIGHRMEWFYPSRNLGVIYTLLILLLIVVTSIKIKGMRAALLITVLAFVALLFVHLNWWETVLGWIFHQSIYLSLGFYLYSSSLLFGVWLISVFVVDRLSYWKFRPGQVSHVYFGGVVNSSNETENMSISLNRQDDFFRHWIIGLGSGDLHMKTMGGKGVEINVPNVLFVGAKMPEIQRLIATKPDVPQQA